MGFNVKELQRKGMDAVNKTTDGVETVVNNTVGDIRNILGHISECAAHIDQIRILALHRAIQYHSTAMQAMIAAEIIPSKLVEDVLNKLLGDGNLPEPRRPRLLHLHNPEVVWKGGSYNITEFDIQKDDINPQRTPYIFVHGMMFSADDSSAYDFYKQFELEARMFNNDTGANYSHADIYLVSYDSDLTDELKLLVRKGIEVIVRDTVIGDDAEFLYFAVLWRIMVERAENAGRVIAPFLERLARIDTPKPVEGMAISHSLGDYVIANASKIFLTQNPNLKVFNNWWCMASALPADAFTNTGSYTISPKIAVNQEDPEAKPGTILWFSRMDAILSYIFPSANNGSLALGVTGALEHTYPLYNLDVTACTHITHMGKDGYFRLLGKSIRLRLGTQLWPGLLCEDLWPMFSGNPAAKI
ncbi:hypothetical protein ACTFRK_18235 [Bacillus cereus group sp. MYBK227-2]|uniref:hypothetical protein n=1 Tax=Bacillus cereus group sp. MYBK227-2 TaxID=3450653 RepID=UPI003F7A1BD8